MFTMNSVSDYESWDMGPRWLLIYPILSHPRLPVCKYFILFSIIIIMMEINVQQVTYYVRHTGGTACLSIKCSVCEYRNTLAGLVLQR